MESEYPIHPAATVFPMMSESEYIGLREHIREHGQRESITLWCGQVIDGRNRLRACQELGKEPDFCELDEDFDPWEYVIAHNLHRRNLSETQRASIAAKMATLRHGSNRHEAKLDGSKDPSTSTEQAAAALNVSTASVKRAKKVQRDGADELQQVMDRDEVPVSLAASFVKAVPDKQEQQAVIDLGKKKGDVRKAIQQEVKTRTESTPRQKPARAFNEDREGDRLADTIRAALLQWPEDKREIAADVIRIVLDEFCL